ncbi:regulatory iron-sulfur-containing complex subunit RicT [Treponema sp.]
MDDQNDFNGAPFDERYADESIVESDIAALEDSPLPDSESMIEAADSTHSPFSPDTPLYRLRLAYSNETFLAAFEGEKLANDALVVVPTRYGRDLAQVIGPVRNTPYINPAEISRVERTASEADYERSASDMKKEAEAFQVCKEKIASHRLDMKLVSVHYLLEEPKILFFFTAENRVDFRELVKDLVGIFKTRIELRQIGVRDESRVVGGLGVCGRGYCCHSVSDKLKPVSIKMAKDQNLSLNSMKISGPCGRLLCCLAYEHGFYHEERRAMPPEGCRIQHDGISWKVVEVNPVAGRLKIIGEDGRHLSIESNKFERSDGRWRLRSDAPNEANQNTPRQQ